MAIRSTTTSRLVGPLLFLIADEAQDGSDTGLGGLCRVTKTEARLVLIIATLREWRKQCRLACTLLGSADVDHRVAASIGNRHST